MDFNVRQARTFAILAVLIGLGLWSGCNRQKYSGVFNTGSDYPHKIRVHDWEGFDSWQPPRGIISREGEKTSHFPWKEEFPESTIVIWSEEGSSEMKQQEIDLRGVVPKGVEGTTHFTLGADGVWTVEFIEGDPF